MASRRRQVNAAAARGGGGDDPLEARKVVTVDHGRVREQTIALEGAQQQGILLEREGAHGL